MIIDATNLIIGRLGTKVAKMALMGEKIDIVNSENAVVTGKWEEVFARYKQRWQRGDYTNGPNYPRMPDRILRRAIRGMLPYKQDKGLKAFKRVMCHIGVPEQFKDAKLESIESADVKKVPNYKYCTLKKICNELGARI